MDAEMTMTVSKYRSLDEAKSELERELNVRARCFPRWIKEGRVNKIDAQDRLDRLASALQILERPDVLACYSGTEPAKQ